MNESLLPGGTGLSGLNHRHHGFLILAGNTIIRHAGVGSVDLLRGVHITPVFQRRLRTRCHEDHSGRTKKHEGYFHDCQIKRFPLALSIRDRKFSLAMRAWGLASAHSERATPGHSGASPGLVFIRNRYFPLSLNSASVVSQSMQPSVIETPYRRAAGSPPSGCAPQYRLLSNIAPMTSRPPAARCSRMLFQTSG